jgi:hypothetical protein
MRTAYFGMVVCAAAMAVCGAAGDAGAKSAAGAPARASVGARAHVPPPRHVAHDASDKPVVHAMRDLYQEDQSFANLFAADGSSEICGPTAMSNVLLYLKHEHGPTFPKLLGDMKDSDRDAHDVVEYMFRSCHTSKSAGTTSAQLQSCTRAELRISGYEPLVAQARGAWPEKKALGPEDLRAESKSEWHAGDPVGKSDRGAILLFGWYDKKTYRREGGHFVVLAGYDADQTRVVYVTNPLIKDYPKDHVYSKVVLEPVAKKTGDLPVAGMWQTEHLFGEGSGEVAVLEDMVIVLPKE